VEHLLVFGKAMVFPKHFRLAWPNGTCFFTLSLIIEGATEKVLSYMMPVRSIYRKKFVLMNKIVFFEYCRMVKAINNL